MTATLLTCLYAGDDSTHFKKYLKDVCENSAFLEAVIIVVDGPLPTTLDKLIKQVDKDPLFKIIWLETNQGLVNALNSGLKACTSEFCIRLDPDDRMRKNRVKRVLEEFNAGDVDVVFNGVEIVDDYDTKIRSDTPIDNLIFYRNPYYHSGSAYNVAAIRKIGGYRPFSGFEDYDLWLRANKHGLSTKIIPEDLSSFRLSTQTIGRRAGLKYFWYEVIFMKTSFMERNLPLKFLPFWVLRLASRLLPKFFIVKLRSYYFKL